MTAASVVGIFQEYVEVSADTNSPRGATPAGSDPDGGVPETPAERRLANWLLVAIVAVIVGLAFWLGDALLDARRADECIASGRRNCAPVTVPVPPPR